MTAGTGGVGTPPAPVREGSGRTVLEVRGWLHPQADVWVLHFPWEWNPLPMNGQRGHWSSHARKSRWVRDTASTLAALAAKIPPLERCRAQVTWWVADRRTRDADNLAALEKPIFDGLVDAGVVTDDAPAFMDKPRARICSVSESGGWVTGPCFTVSVTRLRPDGVAA